MRATSFKSTFTWPAEEGAINESSVRANYQVIKHVPKPFGLWSDIILVPHGKWVIEAVADCWEVGRWIGGVSGGIGCTLGMC